MRRFFVEPSSITQDTARLPKSESLHIVNVLRLRKGDEIELFDGTGTVYSGILNELNRECVSVQIIGLEQEHDDAPPVTLFQSLLKGKKMDFLVQKSTELGVHTFQPLITRYSENRKSQERQQQRWQRIMLEACKQCKRSTPMHINPLTDFNQVDFNRYSSKLMLWENEENQSISPNLFRNQKPVCLLIGPEGGFHTDEVNHALQNGFLTVSLGKRILRAETATLSTIAIVQYLLGVIGTK